MVLLPAVAFLHSIHWDCAFAEGRWLPPNSCPLQAFWIIVVKLNVRR